MVLQKTNFKQKRPECPLKKNNEKIKTLCLRKTYGIAIRSKVFGGGMQSVSLFAQSFCSSIPHAAEQDPNQNTIWFELLS